MKLVENMFTKYVSVNINHITFNDICVQVGNSNNNEFEAMIQKLESQRKEYEMKITQISKENQEMKNVIQKQQMQIEEQQKQQNVTPIQPPQPNEDEILAIRKDFEALNEYTTNLEKNVTQLNEYLESLELIIKNISFFNE